MPLLKYLNPRLLALSLMLSGLANLSCASEARVLQISAAASLAEVFTELEAAFEARNAPVDVRLNFGGSIALARQLNYGAPGDLLAVASPQALEAVGRVVGVPQPFARNRLVQAWSDGNAGCDLVAWAKQKEGGRLALADPRLAPAGVYAWAALEGLGVAQPLVAQRRLVLTGDVRQALALVVRQEVDGALVYQSDLAGVEIGASCPLQGMSEIVYMVATVTEAAPQSRRAQDAQAFLDLLLSDEGRRVLAKYGFGSRPDGER